MSVIKDGISFIFNEVESNYISEYLRNWVKNIHQYRPEYTVKGYFKTGISVSTLASIIVKGEFYKIKENIDILTIPRTGMNKNIKQYN